MSLSNPVRIFFSLQMPVGADFNEAFQALKGKKFEDLSESDIKALDEIAETYQDFSDDPASWIKKASRSDPRYVWWVRLAQALGASVGSGSDKTSSQADLTPSRDNPKLDVEPEQGFDPDVLAQGAPPPTRIKRDTEKLGGIVITRSKDEEKDHQNRDSKKPVKESDSEEDQTQNPLEPRNPDSPKPPRVSMRLRRDPDHENDNRQPIKDPEGEEEVTENRQVHHKREPPKPLWVPTRDIPEIAQRILKSDPYLRFRDRLKRIFDETRHQDQTISEQGRRNFRDLIKEIKLMSKGTENLGGMSADQLIRMSEALEERKDVTQPDWFQANFVTGRY